MFTRWDSPLRYLLDRHPQTVGDPLLARRLAGVLELADRVRDLARDLADPARQHVAAAQLVERRAPDPVLGERQERLGPRLVVAFRRLGEAEHTGGHQVLARHPVRAAPRHLQRDPPSDLGVLGDELIAPLVSRFHDERLCDRQATIRSADSPGSLAALPRPIRRSRGSLDTRAG
jgi:hypothetical protein